jgi:hypothetical protein
MTSSITPLAHALRLLKVELAQARATAEGRHTTSSASARAGSAQQAPSTALQALRSQIRAARSSDGKLPPGKALRLFVQAALFDELGAELQLDPAMGDLVERTCQAIEQDQASAALLADALRELEALAD